MVQLLMVSWVQESKKFQFLVFLQNLKSFRTHSPCVSMRMIQGEYILGTKDLLPNKQHHFFPWMENCMYHLFVLECFIQFLPFDDFDFLVGIFILVILICSSFACSLNSTTYITGVEACCIGDSCLDHTSFKAIIDCGASFTHFPSDVYGIVVKEVQLTLLLLKSLTPICFHHF